MTEAYKKYENVVPIIKRALTTLELCSKVTCRVEDFELIVGNAGTHFCGTGINSDWKGIGWAPRMIEKGIWTLREDGMYHNPDNEEIKLAWIRRITNISFLSATSGRTKLLPQWRTPGSLTDMKSSAVWE